MVVEGYNKLASFLGSRPELQYFRRFSTLNTTNLLYLQAQLANLEEELKNIVNDDKASAGSDEKKAKYPYSVWHLKRSANNASGDSFQWAKYKEIQVLLQQYNTALIQQSQMLDRRTPSKKEVAGLREWLCRPEGGDDFFECSAEANVWSEENESDLIAVCRQQDGVDSFTEWICTDFLSWFHRVWGHRAENKYDIEMGVRTYNYNTIKSITHVTSIIIAGTLPASSIIVLYFMKDTTAKLTVIFMYNLVFSWVLGFLVKARRAELFAAATAFAAVQVTLVANSGGCAPGQ